MGKIVKLSALLFFLLIGGFGYYMLQNGLNPLDLNDIKIAASSTKTKIDSISNGVTEKEPSATESKVYKRKDAQGNWYYSNEPPKKGEDAEVMIYRSDTNLLPPLPEDKKKTN